MSRVLLLLLVLLMACNDGRLSSTDDDDVANDDDSGDVVDDDDDSGDDDDSAANTPPEATPPVVDPDPLYADSTANCLGSVGSDVDGDEVTIRYGWLVGGVDPGIVGEELTPDEFTVGDSVQCVATPSDGIVDGAAAISPAVIVQSCPAGSGWLAECPGDSCRTILEGGFSIGDGDYWIDPMGTGAFEAFCDQTTDNGGWTRIINQNYSTDLCPGAWVPSSQFGGLCTRDTSSGGDPIRSAMFDVWDIPYTEVRGHISAHQYASCDAFGDSPPTSIDDTYADTVSFTVGAPGSRTHLFSYVFGFGTLSSDDSNCPGQSGGAPPHPWVGASYVCESGNTSGGGPSGTWQPQLMFNGSWFQSPVGAATTQDVEGRLIATSSSADEDLGVTEVTLFVR